MADGSLPQNHAMVDQSIENGSSSTEDGPSPSPLGRQVAQYLADLLRGNAPEYEARLTATSGEAAGMSSEELDRLMYFSNYDRDSNSIRLRAGERKIDVINQHDNDIGNPHLTRVLAAAGDLYEELATVTDEQKSLVKSTWRAISMDKKREILRKSWPAERGSLNTSHRADIAIFQEAAVLDQDEVNRVRSRVEENLVQFFWHDINEEDLLEDDNFLVLLDSRSHHKPDEFMHFDANMLRFLASTGVTPYRVFSEPDGTVVQKQWAQTGCFKGVVEPDSASHLPDGCAIFSGEYLEVLERQFHILQFLSSARNLILEESSKIGSADTAPPSLRSSTQSERTCIDDWRRSLVYPYLPPTVDNLDMCSKLIQTRLEEARDLLFGIRECPRTFQEYTKKYETYDPEMLLDKEGKKSIGPNSLATRDLFRDKSVAEAVLATFKDACMWQTLSRRIGAVRSETKGSAGCREAMRELKVYLQEVTLPHLLHSLRSRFLASPAMKKYVCRVTRRISGKYDHRIEFRKDRLVPLIRDKVIWTLFQLATTEVGLKGLDSVTLIIELRRLVENDTVPIVHISSSVYKVIADLALYAELWVQCRAFEPVSFYHASNLDHGLELVETERALVLESQLAREVDALSNPENDEKFFRLGHTIHHSLDVLQYPIDKPRNKPRNVIMQSSEAFLDNFWLEFDKHVGEHCSPDIIEVWKSLWPRKEDLMRTEDWKDTETAPLVGHFAAVNLNFGDEKASASDVPPPSKKSKKKKRKAQIPEPENVEDPRPNRDQDNTMQPETPRISISKRAWQVFHDGLWFVPKEKKKPAELRWHDFLHAMTSLGFSATKMFGSVWRFEPGERAQSAGLERSINFHEPHGNATKLDPWRSRRHGQRLTRVYGIDMSSLDAEK